MIITKGKFLNVAEIVAIHTILLQRYGRIPGKYNIEIIKKIVENMQGEIAGDPVRGFCAVIELFLQTQPFESGNIRTAFAVGDIFLRMNGYCFVADLRHLEARVKLWMENGPGRCAMMREDVAHWLVNRRLLEADVFAAARAVPDAVEEGFAARLRPESVAPPRRPPTMPFPQAAKQVAVFQAESISTFKNVFQTLQSSGRLELQPVVRIVKDLVTLAGRNAEAMLAMYDLYTADAYTYRHCVNVATLAVGFGAFLGYDERQLHWLGLAGFLHDVGKQFIPMEIINAPRRLTREEFLEVQRHPRLGYELLRGFRDIPEAVRRGVLEHHEKADGSGYPDGISGRELSAVGAVIGVVDVYDALSNERAYKSAEPPTRALSMLYKMRGAFLPGLVERFVRCVGVYPVGSLVRLSSGDMAVVCEANPDARTKPRVVVIHDPARATEHLRMLDLTRHPGVSVADCLDPRQYVMDCSAVLKAAARLAS